MGARNSVELLSNSSFHSVPSFWMRLHRLLELMPKEQYMRFVSFGVVETVTLSAIRLSFFFYLSLVGFGVFHVQIDSSDSPRCQTLGILDGEIDFVIHMVEDIASTIFLRFCEVSAV